MNTPVEDIYENFFSLIDDVKLHLLDDEFKETLLSRYLSKALALDCRMLKIKNVSGDFITIKYSDVFKEPILNELGVAIGEIEKFPYEIPATEMWLLAHGMVISYLVPKLNRERLLRESIGDRDYKESSHGNQLQQLMKLMEAAKSEIEEYKISHSFDDFEGFN